MCCNFLHRNLNALAMTETELSNNEEASKIAQSIRVMNNSSRGRFLL